MTKLSPAVIRWLQKLNKFFIEAVENLVIESYAPNTDNNIGIDEITKKYEMYPSILEIRECKR